MKAQKIWFENGYICLITNNGREGSLPLRLFPRLYRANEEQLQKFTLSAHGIHWPELDEDLSYEGFFTEENTSKDRSVLSRIFFQFPELNQRQVARIAGINTKLFQQYIDGCKTPSVERMKSIEEAIKSLGIELSNISLQS